MSVGENRRFAEMSMLSQALAMPEKKSKTKVKKSDTIKHPEFVPIIPLLTDEYWRDIFDKASKGKFPRGFIYENRYLIYKKTNQNVLLPDDHYGLGNTFVTFLKVLGKLQSPTDLAYMNSIVQSQSQVHDPQTFWKKVYKSKEARKVFIRKYIDKRYPEYDQYVRDELYTQINNATDSGSLKSKNYVFDNDELVNIDGFQLLFDEANSRYYVALDKPIKYKPNIISNLEPEVPKQYQHMNNWRLFIGKFARNSVAGAEDSNFSQMNSSVETPSMSNSNIDDD